MSDGIIRIGQTLYHTGVVSDFAIGYKNSNVIGDKIFIPKKVNLLSAKYLKYGKDKYVTHTANGGTKVPLYGDVKETMIGAGYDNYFCELHGVGGKLDEREVNNGNFYSVATGRVQGLKNQLDLSLEAEQAGIIANANNYITGLKDTPAMKWENTAIEIYDEILASKELVRSEIGAYPNTMVMGLYEFMQMQKNAKLRAKMKAEFGKETVDFNSLAALFYLKEVIVGESVHIPDPVAIDLSTANQGDIWKGFIGLYYLDPSEGEVMTFAKRFFMSGLEHEGAGVSEWEWKTAKVRVWATWDNKIVCNEAGYLITLPFTVV